MADVKCVKCGEIEFVSMTPDYGVMAGKCCSPKDSHERFSKHDKV